MTGYNELFLEKSIKIAINFYTKALSRNCVVIDYSFVRLQELLVKKHPSRVASHIFVRD